MFGVRMVRRLHVLSQDACPRQERGQESIGAQRRWPAKKETKTAGKALIVALKRLTTVEPRRVGK
jgi:hypothetical protein